MLRIFALAKSPAERKLMAYDRRTYVAPDCGALSPGPVSAAGLTTAGLTLRATDPPATLAPRLEIFLAAVLPSAWTFLVRLSTCASRRCTRFFKVLAI